MKKFLYLVLSLILPLAICFSCQTKQSPIDELQSLAFELEEEGQDYSEADWEKAIVKFQEIQDDMQQYEYTDEELKEIGRLKGKCVAAIAKASAKKIKSSMHIFEKEMEGAAEELEGAFKEFDNLFDEESE